MINSFRTVVSVALIMVLAACASFNDNAVRSLTEAEIDVLNNTRARLAENQASIQGSLDDLADNMSYALRQQHRLTSNIAKAQLLEAMKSPWTSSELTPTQKEVALYHLFALEQAEQAALAAQVEARHAGIAELKAAYRQLVSSISALIGAQEQLLVHLDQPASTQISLVLQQVLAESQAFRDALDESDNPQLQGLAERVAEREQLIADAELRIVELLRRLEEE